MLNFQEERNIRNIYVKSTIVKIEIIKKRRLNFSYQSTSTNNLLTTFIRNSILGTQFYVVRIEIVKKENLTINNLTSICVLRIINHSTAYIIFFFFTEVTLNMSFRLFFLFNDAMVDQSDAFRFPRRVRVARGCRN